MSAPQVLRSRPHFANKFVFWLLGALTLVLLYVESFGPEGVLLYDREASQLFRSPEIYFQFDDEAGDVLPDGGNQSTGDRHHSLTAPGAAPDGVLDVSYIGDFDGDLQRKPFNESTMKTILVWNNGYNAFTEGLKGGDLRELEKMGCPQPNCRVVRNRTLLPLDRYHAIIFHFRATTLDDLPATRSAAQRWIFKETEPASYIYQFPRLYNGLFNWTYTYRLNSDVPAPYGRVARKTPAELEVPFVRQHFNKTRLAAWFVSNCHAHSGRDQVIKGIKSFMQVDVYGKCGVYKCSREDGRSCNAMLERKYKFYMAFENSLCKDYVTEKFFNTLKYEVVPVVYGSANYKKIAPPHSYINALDFTTTGKLAEYLLYLDSNHTAYDEYFHWKKEYKIVNGYLLNVERVCHLCQKLHTDSSTKVYNDLDAWFVAESKCKRLKKRLKTLRWNYDLVL
uniref:Fucosyltransferase n=2 Tax=Hirondellea gigas TaxID=1518452 RepID=A0A2P2I2W6_9CRUS